MPVQIAAAMNAIQILGLRVYIEMDRKLAVNRVERQFAQTLKRLMIKNELVGVDECPEEIRKFRLRVLRGV